MSQYLSSTENQRARTNQVTKCPRILPSAVRIWLIASINSIRDRSDDKVEHVLGNKRRGEPRPILLSLTREFFIKSTYIHRLFSVARLKDDWSIPDNAVTVYIQPHRKCRIVCRTKRPRPYRCQRQENSRDGRPPWTFLSNVFPFAIYNFARAYL